MPSDLNTDQAGAKKDGQMLPPDAEYLPVEQAEHHRQHQQRAEVPDKHPVAQRHARAGEQTVGKPDKAPAHGTEDHVDIGNVLFHRLVLGSFYFSPRSSMIWSRSRAAYSNSSIRLASFISFSSRAIVSARSRSGEFFFTHIFNNQMHGKGV